MTEKARRERFETDSNWSRIERSDHIREETLWFKGLTFRRIRVLVMDAHYDYEAKKLTYKETWETRETVQVKEDKWYVVSKTEALALMKEADRKEKT